MKNLSGSGKNILTEGFNFLEKYRLLRALELALLAVLCFAAGRILAYLFGWGNPVFSGFWVIMIALIVSNESNTNLADLIQSHLLSVILGVAGGFIMLAVFGVNSFSLFIAVLLVAWLCSFFDWHRSQQLAVMSLAVLVVSNFLIIEAVLWTSAVGRIIEAAVGILLAVGTHILFNAIADFTRTQSGPDNFSKY